MFHRMTTFLALSRAALGVLGTWGVRGRTVRFTDEKLTLIQQRIDAGEAVLVDVRELGESRRNPVPGAIVVPLSQFAKSWSSELNADIQRGQTLYCFCGHGVRALMAAEKLHRQGHDARPLRQTPAVLMKSEPGDRC